LWTVSTVILSLYSRSGSSYTCRTVHSSSSSMSISTQHQSTC